MPCHATDLIKPFKQIESLPKMSQAYLLSELCGLVRLGTALISIGVGL